MMTRSLPIALVGILCAAPAAVAQQKTVTGRVASEQGSPLAAVQVVVQGTNTGTTTNEAGSYSIRVAVGQVLQFRRIGYAPTTRTVGAEDVINVQLRPSVANLDDVVVTALGQTAVQRGIGTSQQVVQGAEIAQTQRDNFLNALQGRVAGVNVTSSSGVPGASSQITIRGISSISSSNQPLFIIDGLPLDNKTQNSNVLASQISGTSFENRGVDFSNRASDLNPEDIESIVVLKGPEAAALYGIDAANGAVVITTKRGQPGGGFEYSNRIRVETTRTQPDIQRTYGVSGVSGVTSPGTASFLYWGEPYAAGTAFYDNVDGFFQTATSQAHNLAFSGAAADNRVNYRISGSLTQSEGVVPNTTYDRYNISGASQAQVNDWLDVDLTMQYAFTNNDQTFKGAGGPLIGLLVWPQTDNASDWITPAGTRRTLTSLAASAEIDNPYFNVNRNFIASQNNRIIANLGVRIAPFSWGNLRTNLGTDTYVTQSEILRHPESAYGVAQNGIIDVADDITRSLNAQTLLNVNPIRITDDIQLSGLVGNQISDYKSTVDALWGRDFLEPNFVSVNNASVRTSRTTIAQRRLIGLFAQATFDYKSYLFVNLTGRNDWTSTIPEERNSFFYPGVSTSFIFSDAFPSIGRVMTGKLRAAYAEVGKDARPYAFRPSLEYKPTSYGGYGYGFTGPNVNLRPEFAKSYEVGTELTFLDGRLGVDATYYRKQTDDQIVNDIRGSYATGFILFNLNGASTRNEGVELTLRGQPVVRPNLTWDVIANFDRSRGRVLTLPNELPESYSSDTWLYGNVRNGTSAGRSTSSLTGFFYLRNEAGDLLIDPSTGLPLRSSTFIDAGYDRQPDWTIGLTNEFSFGRARLSFLWDFRRGGDILNATEHYLTTRGLSTRTLDRDEPRVVAGVLRDGKENSATPTRNNIVVVPSVQNNFYQAMSEELFIEQDINWARLRDVTFSYQLPPRFGATSVFVTGTDLLLFTNYSGLDPIVNGNTAAVGGSGAVGIDYGNFPIPRGLNFGLRTSF